MVKLLNKIKNIIIGFVYKFFKMKTNLANDRLNICKNCPSKLHTTMGDVCEECGCILDAKTRVKDEECDLDKW